MEGKWSVTTFTDKNKAKNYARKVGGHVVTLDIPPRTKEAKERWEYVMKRMGFYAFWNRPYAVLWR